MRDFRFHIATIMAIFLALGVGITVGYSLAVSQQMYPLRNQIQAVRKHNAAVEEDNKSLKERRDELDEQVQQLSANGRRLAELALAGRLTGKRVSLITVGRAPSTPLVDSIWSTLALAGASRLNEIRIRGSLLPQPPQVAAEILSRIHAAPDDRPDAAIAEALAHSIGSSVDPMLPSALNHRGVPIDEAGDFTRRPDMVILLSLIQTRSELKRVRDEDSPETRITQGLQAQGIRVVEVEPQDSRVSAASYYRSLGLSCVDDVDTAEGKAAMVWAALGYSGYYGRRSEADSLLPEIPHPQAP